MDLVLMGRTAIIDLGTNTFNLLIVKQSEDGYEIIFKSRIPAKLGAGGFAQQTIIPESFQRGIEAMCSHHEAIEKHNVDQVYAFATSAMRDAQNGNDFVEQIKEKTGIEINIISGDREAELIYKGVQRALDIGEQPELIMDIGGGSTEFIIADANQILWKHSFDLGVSRLFEFLKPSDPLRSSDLQAFEDYLNEHLTDLFEALNKHKTSSLIGSSGSFDSLAEMIEKQTEGANRLKGNTEYKFSITELETLHTRLIKSTYAQRTEMKGLVSYRIETIPLASAFIHYIINKLSIDTVRLSTYALREGVISELAAD